jgi:acetoin utilization deacetylase AcuC-like enzyme
VKIFYSKKCLGYGSPEHPESPDRISNTVEFLKKKGFKFIEPKPCSEEDLLLAHSKEHVEKIESENFYDPDTPPHSNIFELAKLSAGSAIGTMEVALKGEKTFSLMRPPGHHAGTNGKALGASSLGFCYFNNVAIAVKKSLTQVKKVVIIDTDCHHGNGTQEIFLGNPRILFISLHRFPFYPGTGEKPEENCLNYPLSPETTKNQYLSTLKEALEKTREFNPDLIGVSAGFDTYKEDHVGGLGLEKESYFKIGEMIKNLKKPIFIVLEGGYGRDFPECIYKFLKGLES